ncbi:unnamed protein product, partial [Ectocarpus sp. 12 AP-2014]
VLADLGCAVTLCERHAVLAALLENAVHRLRCSEDPHLAANGSRMQVLHADAVSLMPVQVESSDVIYLDPMFPAQRKALPAKDLQLLQLLLDDARIADPRGECLLPWAREQAVARVVVKRPRLAERLPGPDPGHSIVGKAVRFDVYPVN